MTKVTIFQAGTDAFYTGSDLFEAVEAANSEGWNVNYDDVEIARKGYGLVDGKIYYTNDYDALIAE